MIVVIGGPDALADATRRVALVDVGAAVAVATATDVAAVAAIVEDCQPFAILMSAELYDFDPGGFDAVARDVGATLIPVDTRRYAPERIDAVIKPMLKGAAAAYTLA